MLTTVSLAPNSDQHIAGTEYIQYLWNDTIIQIKVDKPASECTCDFFL